MGSLDAGKRGPPEQRASQRCDIGRELGTSGREEHEELQGHPHGRPISRVDEIMASRATARRGELALD